MQLVDMLDLSKLIWYLLLTYEKLQNVCMSGSVELFIKFSRFQQSGQIVPVLLTGIC